MKQVGIHFESVSQGIKTTAVFGGASLALAYRAFSYNDKQAGICSIGFFIMAGLTYYNTLALGLSADYEYDSVG